MLRALNRKCGLIWARSAAISASDVWRTSARSRSISRSRSTARPSWAASARSWATSSVLYTASRLPLRPSTSSPTGTPPAVVTGTASAAPKRASRAAEPGGRSASLSSSFRDHTLPSARKPLPDAAQLGLGKRRGLGPERRPHPALVGRAARREQEHDGATGRPARRRRPRWPLRPAPPRRRTRRSGPRTGRAAAGPAAVRVWNVWRMPARIAGPIRSTATIRITTRAPSASGCDPPGSTASSSAEPSTITPNAITEHRRRSPGSSASSASNGP